MDAKAIVADGGQDKLDFHDDIEYLAQTGIGLTRATVEEISAFKDEPDWMLQFRLRAFEHFQKRPMPDWIDGIGDIDLSKIVYYRKPSEREEVTWDSVPEKIKATFEKLGIPEAERKFLSGVEMQMDSEVVYHSIKEELSKIGVIFMSTDQALREHSDLFRKYFGTVVPPEDNKFAALNSALWSGGSFLFIPKGVDVPMPMQAYFRINARNMGQFERTLIIAEEGAKVQYIEGCSAPSYSSDSLHAAVVEVIALDDAKVRYVTMQSWPTDVYNLVTKRAHAYARARIEWCDANWGCLAEGSMISTEQGEVAIESLRVGDRVLSYDLEQEGFVWQPVSAKRFAGVQQVCEVRSGGRRLLTTDNHPFLSYRYDPLRASKLRRYSIDYVRADALAEALVPIDVPDHGQSYRLWTPPDERVVDFVGGNQYQASFASRRIHRSLVRAPEYTSPDIMWLFGLFVGDGDIAKRQAASGGLRWGKVGFSVPRADRARSKLEAIMSQIATRTATERSDGVHLDYNSVDLVEFFEHNGFTSGARRKTLPSWISSLPIEERRAFIAGYLDSDGHVMTKGARYVAIKSVNLGLLKDTANIITSLGVKSRINTIFDGERQVEILGYAVTTHGSHILTFLADPSILAHCSDDFRRVWQERLIPRTSARGIGRSNLSVPKGLAMVRVKRRDVHVSARTWDIEVSGTGNFVSQGFIVHNSRLTAKYPSIFLRGDGASADVISVAVAGPGQHQDTGAKAIHLAPNTTSRIVSKSISYGGGRATYRGQLKVAPGATGVTASVRCDALMLDDLSRSDTYPYIDIGEDDTTMTHEATVGKVSAEQIFYMMSRGLTENEATSLVVQGFLEVFTKELPMEYAIEFNRLVRLEMDGALG